MPLAKDRVRFGRAGVYKITHTDSGRCYVGSSADIDTRWKEHIRDLRKGVHNSPYLQNVWNTYGQDALSFETLHECDLSAASQDNEPFSKPWFKSVGAILVACEQSWMDTLHPVFNSSPTAGSLLGYKQTPEARAKLSQSRMGIGKGIPLSPERRAQQSAALMGRPVSAETRAKISAAHIGMPSPLKGIPRTPEVRAKISATNMGREVTAETRVKISVAGTGRKHTEDTKRQMSISRTGKPRPQYVIDAMHAGLREWRLEQGYKVD